MISRVPTYSGKNMSKSISRDLVLPILGIGVFTVIMLVAYPWESLTAISILYLGLIPLSIRSYRRRIATAQPPADQA